MDQRHISCGSACDRFPSLPIKHPRLVAQHLGANEDNTKEETFCTMHDPPPSAYRCLRPELLERGIRGFFHGWMVLAHNVVWSLWNPVTFKTIRLPPLIWKDGDSETMITQCCLSSPPNNPTSVLMLTRTGSPTVVYCRLDCNRKSLRWKEITYAKQLRNITGDDGFLHCLTCYNGKVYALITGHRIVIQVDIVVKDKEDIISLLSFGKLPFPFYNGCSSTKLFLKKYCQDLFYIKLDFDVLAKKTISAVYLFKLNRTSMIWEEMEDLKDALFFIDLACDCSVFYRYAITSDEAGYAHILGEMAKVIYSYDVKDKTISLSSMSCLEQSPKWECRLLGDHGEIKCETDPEDDEVDINNIRINEENFEPHHLNIPFDVLNLIMEFCVGVEYLNFRATCKHCRLTAPMIQWSNETSLRRLQTYSLVSPWLVVLDKHRGIITFTDPMFGDKYFITPPKELTGDLQICCSRYGWLLLRKLNGRGELFFFNPFTKVIGKLPDEPDIDRACFSHPPTSPDCVIIGLSTSFPLKVFIHIPSFLLESWALFHMDFGSTTPHSFLFPTMFGACFYALNQGALHAFLETVEERTFRNAIVAEAPRGICSSSAQEYFISNCHQHILLVVTDELGGFVEVLKWNASTQEWEKVESLGRHMIYICGGACLCMDAKTPEMENKIFFPRLHSKSGKIMFYSLDTHRFHTFNGRNSRQCLGDFIGTKYSVYSHAWIEPSWS